MAQKQELRIRQSQRLALTPGLRQSLDVLAMSSAELAELVANEARDNPCLIVEYTPLPGGGGDVETALRNRAQQQSLGTHLEQQIDLMRAPERVRHLARYLVWNLDDDGYLTEDLATLQAASGASSAEMTAALALVQTCEPVGVAARSVAECIALQLRAQGAVEDDLTLVSDHLPQLTGPDWRKLAKPGGPTEATLSNLRLAIRKTSPRPAADLASFDTPTLGADILVSETEPDQYAPALAARNMPVLAIDASLKRAAETEEARARFESLHERVRSLTVAIRRRSETLARIAAEIVSRQHGFFSHGHEALAPLSQAELASHLGLHPSTIARAISGKYLGCRFGLFPLSDFFSTALATAGNEAGVSARAVRHRIARMIHHEAPDAVLPDAAIAQMLRETGVDISRRTVAKYRQCLKIPSSSKRLKSKNAL